MKKVRLADERGHTDHGWLDARHTFSFGRYVDRKHLGFRTLRVINEDRIAPGQGFGMHSHEDMEILTYVISGQLEHRDSLGNQAVLSAGELQCMTAGSGIRHSEINPSDDETVHLLQIWIEPQQRGLEPNYEQMTLWSEGKKSGVWQVVSQKSQSEILKIHQDVSVWAGRISAGETFDYDLSKQRSAWLQMIDGEVQVDDISLKSGDGVGIYDQNGLSIQAEDASEFLLFDLTEKQL